MAMYIEKIKVPEQMEEFVSALRAEKGMKSNAEVVEYLLPIAGSRLNATRTYANKKKKKKEAAASPKPAKKAKAAPKAKKAAKGPLARKKAAAVKAKAPKVRKSKGPSQEKMDKISAQMEKDIQAQAAAAVLD